MNSTELNEHFATWLRFNRRKCLVVPNVILLGSPWESDVIKVNESLLWEEFEVKVSVADYRNDFQKSCDNIVEGPVKKHDFYASSDPATHRWWRERQVPKPARFSFVVPEGMLDGINVPERYGVIEYNGGSQAWSCFRIKRPPKRLLGAHAMEPTALLNLAIKSSWKT